MIDNCTEAPWYWSARRWAAGSCFWRSRSERVAGMIGIAAAPDFTRDLMWDRFTEDIKNTLKTKVYITSHRNTAKSRIPSP